MTIAAQSQSWTGAAAIAAQTSTSGIFAGTPIATPQGTTSVEHLAAGDTLCGAFGGAVTVVGLTRCRLHNVAWLPERLAPVRIKRGALGNLSPRQDVILGADQGLVFGDTVVTAGALVNGGAIRYLGLEQMPEVFTYWRVVTERPATIFAGGLATETEVGFPLGGRFGAMLNPGLGGQARHRVTETADLPQPLRARVQIANWALAMQAA